MIEEKAFIKLLEFKSQKLSTILYLYDRGKREIKAYCRYNIFLHVLRFWELVYDLIFVSLTDGKYSRNALNAFFNIENMTTYMLKTMTGQQNMDHHFVEFYSDFKKSLAISTFEKIMKVYNDKSKSTIEKLDEITTLILEHVNIRLIELSNIDISCKVLKEQPEIDCPYINDLPVKYTTNVIKIMLVPEYFDNDKILTSILNAILEHIKQPDLIKLVIDFRVVVSRSKEIDVQRVVDITKETILDKVIEKFGNVIFYKPFYGISVEYENKKGIRIVKSCTELEEIIKEHVTKLSDSKSIVCSAGYI